MAAIRQLVGNVFGIYMNRRIPRAAAALSYYLTMTIFPMIICLYALFGDSYDVAMRLFDYIEQFLTPNAAELIKTFLTHVAESSGTAVLVAAVTTLIMSASAAVRVLQGTICEMQGGNRFRAVSDFLISFALAAALLFSVYFSFVVLLTGYDFLRWIEQTFFIAVADSSWVWVRFVLLGGIALLLLWGIFGFTRPRDDRYLVLPGAVFATAGIVVMSTVFSRLIASSARYSLVYGSLASLILLMFWLYLICQAIFVGAALNVALKERKATGNRQQETVR